MEAVSKEEALESLRDYTRSLPPLAAIQARVEIYDRDRLRLAAPLAANVNDKGSAFGGSMTSLMTYAGWGLVVLQLQQAGVRADVFVADSRCVTSSLCTATCAPKPCWRRNNPGKCSWRPWPSAGAPASICRPALSTMKAKPWPTWSAATWPSRKGRMQRLQ